MTQPAGSSNTDGIILSIRNPLIADIQDKFAYITKTISHDEIYKDGYVITCGLRDDAHIYISYVQGFLHIRTSYDVDIYLRGDIPATAIQVETKGLCAISASATIKEGICLHLNASQIILNAIFDNASFICLFTSADSYGLIRINKPFDTKNLILRTHKLVVAEKLSASQSTLELKYLDILSKGKLVLKKAADEAQADRVVGTQHTSFINSVFAHHNSRVIKNYNSVKYSTLKAQEIMQAGFLELNSIMLKNLVTIHFINGSTSNFVKINLVANDIQIATGAHLTGMATRLEMPGKLLVDGSIEIDGLDINAHSLEVPKEGIITSKSDLRLTYQKELVAHGVVSANNLVIYGEQAIAAFGGSIVGKHNLDMKVAMTAILFGGRIAGHNVIHKSGVMINIFGITNAYHGLFDSLSCIEFGNIHVPYIEAPNSAASAYELISKNLEQIHASIPTSIQEVRNLTPSSYSEAWHMLSSKFGIIRVIAAKISIPLSAGMTLSYQAVSLILQLMRLRNALKNSSNKSFSEHTNQEILLTLLELKGLVAAGNALKSNIQQAKALYTSDRSKADATTELNASQQGSNNEEPAADNSHSKMLQAVQTKVAQSLNLMKDTALELGTDITPLFAPSLQNDSMMTLSAPAINVTWTESRQDFFSFRSGVSITWNQYELSAFDQVDYGVRFANSLLFNAGRRYQGGLAYTNHLNIYANKLYVAKEGVLWSAKSTHGVVDEEFISKGDTHFANGSFQGKGTALFDTTATAYNSDMRYKFKEFERRGCENYAGEVLVETQHISSSLDSALSALESSSIYQIDTDTSDLQGAERHYRVTYKIRGMPITELEDLFHGRAQYANKVIERSISASSQQPGDTIVLRSTHGSDVERHLSIPGRITIGEEISSSSLSLESSESDIEIKHNVTTLGHQHYVAAGDIKKPNITTESLDGNITFMTEGAIDNSHGGKVYAYQGSAYVGGSLDNNTYELGKRSTIEGQTVFVMARDGNVTNRHGLIRAGKFVRVYASGGIDNIPLEVERWHACGFAKEYHGGEIIGGGGTEYSNGYGAIVDADGVLNNYASNISSSAHTYVHGYNGVSHRTMHSKYTSSDYNYSHGAFNTIYKKEESALWAPATIFGQRATIGSSEGGIHIYGANTLAPDGTTIWSKGQHLTELARQSVTVQEKKVKIGLFKSTEELTEQREHISVFKSSSGTIQIISLDDAIKISGAAFYGTPHLGARLLFQAQGDISVNPAILDNSYSCRAYSLNVNIAGQSIYGGYNGNWAQRLSSLDQTFASARDFTQSRHPVDAAINAYSLMGSVDDLASSIVQDGVIGTIAKRTGASAGITRSKSVYNYQRLGAGYIMFFDEVIFDSKLGNVDLGVEVTAVRRLYVHADTFRAHGTELNSSSRSKTQTIAPTLGLTGSADVCLTITEDKSRDKFFTHQDINVEEFEVNARVMELSGSKVTATQTKGKVDTLVTKPLIGSTIGKQKSLSASAAGNASVSINMQHEETYDARGVLRVTDYNGMQMKVAKHIEYGESGVVDREGKALELSDVTKEHHDIDLRTKNRRFSTGTNLVEIGNPKGSCTIQLGVDTQDRRDRITETGLNNISDTGHKFTLVHYVKGDKPEVVTAESRLPQQQNETISEQPTKNMSVEIESQQIAKDLRPSATVDPVAQSEPKSSAVTLFGDVIIRQDPDLSRYDIAEDNISRSIKDFIGDPLNMLFPVPSNQTAKSTAHFEHQSTLTVLYDAVTGNPQAKLEMRHRFPKGAEFFDSYDPYLTRSDNDSAFMAEAKMYGRAVINIRDGVVHVLEHPHEVITVPFVFGADMIEGALHYYGNKPYDDLARQRNLSRIETIVQLWNADSLTQREAILTCTGSALLFSGMNSRAAPTPVFRSMSLEKIGLSLEYGGGKAVNCGKNASSGRPQSNFIQGLQQRSEFALQEANLLDVNGKLTNFALNNAQLAVPGEMLGNQRVIDILKARSPHISEWGKYKTEVTANFTKSATRISEAGNVSLNSILEKLEIHFYGRADKSGKIIEVCYDIDFKAKVQGGGRIIDIFPQRPAKGDPWPRPKFKG